MLTQEFIIFFRFIEGKPLLSEFESQILFYQELERKINSEPEYITIGALALFTGEIKFLFTVYEFRIKKFISSLVAHLWFFFFQASLKMSLTAETQNWMVDYGRFCNKKYHSDMEQIFAFVDEAGKKLNRQIKDLDDIRIGMAALKEIREHQINIDFQVGPIEVNGTPFLKTFF